MTLQRLEHVGRGVIKRYFGFDMRVSDVWRT